MSAAHPRSRGENAALDKEGAGVEGSSPLTRGKRGASGDVLEMEGLIPAHAGKTSSAVTLATALPGSSPLTRGKPPRW